jgi:hypothetical protein
MKKIIAIAMLCIGFSAFTSCKKSNDAAAAANTPPAQTDWAATLKGTVWAGTMSYTTGTFHDAIPFSVVLNADGTLTLGDQGTGTYTGKWSVDSTNKVLMVLRLGARLTATVSASGLSNFASSTFTVSSFAKAARADSTVFANTIWTRQLNGKTITIKFHDGNNMEISTPGSTSLFATTYTIRGAGIRFRRFGGFFADDYDNYVVFHDNYTTMAGFETSVIGMIDYNSWVGKK